MCETEFPTPLLNAEQVADILGIGQKSVHKLAREGRLGSVRVTKKERRFTREQVQAYVEAQTVDLNIDNKRPKTVRSALPKGGKKSIGVSGTDLRKEMRSW